jgi:predicted porin
MRKSCFSLVLLGFPLPSLADAANFDDSSLFSALYFTSAQSYQIHKQRCELGSVFSRGNLNSKTIDMSLQAHSQGGVFDCAQSLEQKALVIGVSGKIEQTAMDGDLVRYESLATNYAPYLAFQLSPTFSFGVSQAMESAEKKNHTGHHSSSSQRLLLSGTWHEGPWEATIAYADRFRDSTRPSSDLPRSLSFGARYEYSPLLTAGFIYTRTDYPGIDTEGLSSEPGQGVAAALSTQLTPELKIELSYRTESNPDGNADGESHNIGVLGQYKINEEIKIVGFLNQFRSQDRAFTTMMAAYGLGLSLSR